jgi:hypothetical protein
MDMTQVPGWRVSSYSGSGGGQCTQVAAVPGKVLVRDSKDLDGPRLVFGPRAWREFAGRVKAGA